MNGRAIPGAYLFRLHVCDKEMSWPHNIGETHQPDCVVYVRDSEKFRLTNVIPERIIFVSRGITVKYTYTLFPHYFLIFCLLLFTSVAKKLFLGGGRKPPSILARPNLRMCERLPNPSLRWLLFVMVISCLCSTTAWNSSSFLERSCSILSECR